MYKKDDELNAEILERKTRLREEISGPRIGSIRPVACRRGAAGAGGTPSETPRSPGRLGSSVPGSGAGGRTARPDHHLRAAGEAAMVDVTTGTTKCLSCGRGSP